MILGIGIDSVEISRFIDWHTLSEKQLLRIFSKDEIDYCLHNVALSAQRFAARFAAREAFFKAFTQYKPHHAIPFLTMCRLISLHKIDNVPTLILDPTLREYIPKNFRSFVSLTHTNTVANAFVILSESEHSNIFLN